MTNQTESNFQECFIQIPSHIAKDPNIDGDTALLYGLLLSLSKKKGYSWASDEYLANEFNCTPRVISKRLKKLDDNCFIKREIERNGLHCQRKIYPILDIPVKKFINDLVDRPEIESNETFQHNMHYPPEDAFSKEFYLQNDLVNTKQTNVSQISLARPDNSKEFYLQNDLVSTDRTNVLKTNISVNNINKQQHSARDAREKKAAVFLDLKSSDEIYDCLKNIEIPLQDKIYLTKKYLESKVDHCVKWATHHSTKIKKNLQSALKWACDLVNPPEIPKSKEDLSSENKKIAQKAQTNFIHKTLRIDALNTCVEIYHVGANAVSKTLNYTEKAFKEQFENTLRKMGINNLQFLNS